MTPWLTDEASPVAAEELRPQQVAVGVSGGLSIMIHGVRLLLEQHGDFVVAVSSTVGRRGLAYRDDCCRCAYYLKWGPPLGGTRCVLRAVI